MVKPLIFSGNASIIIPSGALIVLNPVDFVVGGRQIMTVKTLNSPLNATIQLYSDPTREATRQRINSFIKTSGIFTVVVVDFDAVLKNPAIPNQLNPTFNSGDFKLYPNVARHQAMADAFPLGIFNQFKNGVSMFN